MEKLLKNILKKINQIRVKNNDAHNKVSLSNIYPLDFKKEHQEIISYVRPFTMTSEERIYSLIEAIKYVNKYQIEGDIVECGVWRGGSMMAAAMILNKLNDMNRNIYLYDTFEGMTIPTKEDIKYNGDKASDLLKVNPKNKENRLWAYASLEDVQQNFDIVGFDLNRVKFIKGRVEKTLLDLDNLPLKIALLRLDTDWYHSTKVELEILYPILNKNGILIIDDYGHWQGCKKAVDEYFDNKAVFLNRIDYTCRLVVKT